MVKQLVPLVFLAACAADGTSSQPAQSVSGGSAEQSADDPSDPAPESPSETPTLFGGFTYSPASCDDNSVYLEGHYDYTDGTPTDNVTCQYQFEDGSTLDSCFGVHSAPVQELVRLTIRDATTGAETSSEAFVRGPATFETTLDVTTSGLSISWNANNIYGGQPDVGAIAISIDPADAVVAADPTVFSQPQGAVSVTRAGTYKVTAFGVISFGEEGGCSKTIEQNVEVVADGGTCDHNGDGDTTDHGECDHVCHDGE